MIIYYRSSGLFPPPAGTTKIDIYTIIQFIAYDDIYAIHDVWYVVLYDVSYCHLILLKCDDVWWYDDVMMIKP